MSEDPTKNTIEKIAVNASLDLPPGIKYDPSRDTVQEEPQCPDTAFTTDRNKPLISNKGCSR